MLIPVVLSGGSGTRLWPLSRELYPKQLLPLVAERTMLQETVARTRGLPDLGPPIVVCNENHRFMVAEQLRELGHHAAGNRARAGRTQHGARGGDRGARGGWCIVAGRPGAAGPAGRSCHPGRSGVRGGGGAGSGRSGSGRLVTFGVVADRVETGYGYIRRAHDPGPVFRVAEFVEKPDAATARRYIESGEYYWNSGMFMFRASAYLAELGRHAPAMLAACRAALAAAGRDLDFLRLPAQEFSACPADSIDYAVMEKTEAAVVVPLAAGWSDVGSWAALADALPRDEDGNVAVGDVITEDCTGSYLHSTSRLIAGVGLRDHVVVETKDAVLVAPRDRVQDVSSSSAN